MVGDGPLLAGDRGRRPGPNITLRSGIDDEELRALYRGATALVYPCVEDFGIVMAEAQACGTPVIGVDAGGALDIVREETGWLVEPTVRPCARRSTGRPPSRSIATRSAPTPCASRRRASAPRWTAIVGETCRR